MAFPQGLALPLVPEKLFSSPVNAYLGTSDVYQKINSVGSYCCDYGGGDIGHPSTPDVASQYCFVAPGQPLAPSGEPPWPFRGPPHVGFPSSWT